MPKSAERIVAVIEAVSASALPLSLRELVAATQLPRATSYRLVAALCEAGVLLREPKSGGFSPGPKLNLISLNLMSNGSFRSARHSILQSLATQIGETCNFTTFHNGGVLYVDRVESAWPLRMSLQPGSTTPLYCTSSGKLYLSLMPAAQRVRLLYSAPIPRFTPKTITDPRALEADLCLIRKRKVATDDEGFLTGLISVAVPVYGHARVLIGTVSVHALAARLSLEAALFRVPQLRRAAADLGSEYRRLPLHAS